MKKIDKDKQYVVILGTSQDGGVPQVGCQRSCCRNVWTKRKRRLVSCLAIVDNRAEKRWLIDATPDFKNQLERLNTLFPTKKITPGLAGIFLTHGHVGHYTGLLNLENAIMNAKKVDVFVMPRMKSFLSDNRPWKDLVKRKNITLRLLENERTLTLSQNLSLKSFLVPHRAEYSETIGFKINGPNKKMLYIPDIDSWELMQEKIEDKIKEVDWALVDGTFFDTKELPYRDISQVPHPFISHSINLFKTMSMNDKKKVFFTHLHHTNQALLKTSKEYKKVIKNGFNIAVEKAIFRI